MARELEKTGGLFKNPAERAGWEKRAVERYNKGRDDKVASFEELAAKDGTDSHIGGMLLEHVGNALEPKLRLASGEINPRLPKHIQEAKWAKEPKNATVMGEAYKRALALNQKLADDEGLGLFMSQWMNWDRIRQRLEPHENMFPGLGKLPAPTQQQLRAVMDTHGETGHAMTAKTEEGKLKPTKPLKGSPSRMGYLGLGGATVGLTAAQIAAGGDRASARERKDQ